MRLRTLLGDHPGTAALRNGSIKSDLVQFDFAQYSPTNKGFKPMVREAAFDVVSLAELGERLARLTASDLLTVLSALCAGGGEAMSPSELSAAQIDAKAAAVAVAAAFQSAFNDV